MLLFVGEDDLWSESAQCMLDCGGHRISIDASACPSGTVVFGRTAEDASDDARPDAIKRCGKGSAFRNISVVSHGRIDFASYEDALVKDCDFIDCGNAEEWAGDGGAIRGCASATDATSGRRGRTRTRSSAATVLRELISSVISTGATSIRIRR